MSPDEEVSGGLLFRIGRPFHVTFYCEGRIATRQEVLAAINKGLPTLRDMAEVDAGSRRRVATGDPHRDGIGAVMLWTVYNRPTDYPHSFVARRFEGGCGRRGGDRYRGGVGDPARLAPASAKDGIGVAASR